MAYVIVCLAAFGTAVLTLFSGFGLGSLLLPVFALFFPLENAVAVTAIVHLCNNLFKVGLLGRHAKRDIVLRFGIPAALFALLGALLLAQLAHASALKTYLIGGRVHAITPLSLVLGGLIVLFALLESLPGVERWSIDRRWIPFGGALSGFFGGLSGHQGALRAAFLVRSGLDRDAFLGTSVVCAVLVDVSRLLVYGWTAFRHPVDLAGSEGRGLIVAATLAAFLGSYLGTRWVRKVTLRVLQRCVGVGLLLLGVAIGAGLV
jgi:uncharacterized membrane protein YfcA